ncbi:hypothetical protein [Streptomyces azureus]|uniref:hypothetical protein n=1 Tax=Streptomyces azureus TaxID=146537 RepID=UPI00143162F1|nr:hypothetical protein [Streptomyces azureus]
MLRPRWFVQNFSEHLLYDPVLSGEVRLPAGGGEEAFTDIRPATPHTRTPDIDQGRST